MTTKWALGSTCPQRGEVLSFLPVSPRSKPSVVTLGLLGAPSSSLLRAGQVSVGSTKRGRRACCPLALVNPCPCTSRPWLGIHQQGCAGV